MPMGDGANDGTARSTARTRLGDRLYTTVREVEDPLWKVKKENIGPAVSKMENYRVAAEGKSTKSINNQ
ncbi:hypothetical protein KM043_014751 [Ampulex compressa]|nr:hypothetical protein KM043_014751 [Ampulex compressa]